LKRNRHNEDEDEEREEKLCSQLYEAERCVATKRTRERERERERERGREEEGDLIEINCKRARVNSLWLLLGTIATARGCALLLPRWSIFTRTRAECCCVGCIASGRKIGDQLVAPAHLSTSWECRSIGRFIPDSTNATVWSITHWTDDEIRNRDYCAWSIACVKLLSDNTLFSTLKLFFKERISKVCQNKEFKNFKRFFPKKISKIENIH